MSISGTLSSALSGLTVNARAAELVSSNVANALTEGYARRELQVGPRVVGGTGQGVTVLGVDRVVDQALLSDRRMAEAGAGNRQRLADFHAAVEAAIGTTGEESSLGGRVAALEKSLIEAASRPESEARLANVADAARALAGHLNAAADSVQAERAAADGRIAASVDGINAALAGVAEINVQIRAVVSSGRDPSALMDQRQQLVDRIAAAIPLREVARDHGQIALFTDGGAILLDGRPAALGFAAVGLITPDMTLASGALSGLTLNGRPIATAGAASLIGGGTLAADFAIRDELGVAAQGRLDAVARDLVERLADPGVDPTLVVGDAGLFTDGGAAFDPLDETGLAQRLTFNALADPRQGGALWRLRDGLGAAAAGPAGNGALLSSLAAGLSAPRDPASGGFMSGARGFATLAADLLSGVSAARLSAETEVGFTAARSEALKTLELQGGVDTDQEMQKLLLIEQAYAANAKVVQTVDELINLLLGL